MNEPNNNDKQIEAVLRGLPLRQPSEMLDHRIGRTLTRRAFPWRELAAAACFGGACFWFGFATGQQDATTSPRISASNEAAQQQPGPPAKQQGPMHASRLIRIDAQWPIARAYLLYDIDDGPPVRATIQDTIERTRWIDPENNRDVELIRPVREVSFTRDTPY